MQGTHVPHTADLIEECRRPCVRMVCGTYVPHTSELITDYRRQGVPALWGTHVTYTPGLIKGCRQVCGRKLTHVSFPPSLGRENVGERAKLGERAFAGCYDLVSVDFRSSSRPAFIAWAVGSSQNRNNWQVTTVMRLRNVLSLITVLAWTPRDVDSVDPYGLEEVFLYCPCGRDHRCFPCDDPDYDSMADDVDAYERYAYERERYGYEREEDQWDNHYNDSLNWYISECDRDR